MSVNHQRERLRELAAESRLSPYVLMVALDYCELAARRGLDEEPYCRQLAMYARRNYMNERTFKRAVRVVAGNFQFTPAYPVRGHRDAEGVITELICMSRPDRHHELVQIWPRIAPSERAAVLSFMWTDTEGPSRQGAIWLRRFLECGYVTDGAARPSGTLIVYRGVTSPRFARSLSWTLDRERAEWFAQRFSSHGNGRVYRVTVESDKTLGYFTERQEHEVVVNPHNLPRIDCVAA